MTNLAGLITGALLLINQVLAATIVLTSFSLLIYLLFHNFQSQVARAFCALFTFLFIVYAGDVVLYEVQTKETAFRWLKFQWIGIAFVPAAYVHFSDALLRSTNLHSRLRWVAVLASYAGSIVFLWMVLATDLLVVEGPFDPPSFHLTAGPLFWIFTLYYALTVLWGAANLRRARRRCLTRASRRRMTYLGLAFIAPALGVFPYLVLAGSPEALPPNPLQLSLMLGNIAVLTMSIVMAYSVAYFGALTPDRVVKHNLIHYLLRGPLVGAAVIFTMLAIPKVQQVLGMPRDTLLIFAVVGVMVFMQLAINRAKPFIDRLIYRQDRDEIVWIQTLDRRLLTSADLNAFLENTLAALCDLLQVRTGFVVATINGQYRLEAYCGDRQAIERALEHQPLKDLSQVADGQQDSTRHFFEGDGYWLTPLYNEADDTRLGVLGVEARTPTPDLSPDEQSIATILINRAREALEDRHLQQGIFDTLATLLPGIERLQRWRNATRYAGSLPVEIDEDDPIYSPEFQQWVKDALSHYWGGPKLTESPLLGLRIVRDQLLEQASPAHALRTVLNEAIERMRPEGERQMTTAEWLLYNILELKFIRGLKVREIAGRLAMSESDLYRKQRVAIAEVARTLADLEQNGTGPRPRGNGDTSKLERENHLDKAV
jgi:hypothetical protein